MYKNYLEGEKIFLREVRETDVTDDYYSWINDTEVNQYLETRYYPRSKNDILEFVRKMDGNSNEILFAICVKEKDKHIGNIKLGPINWLHRKGDISLLIGNKDYWGKGIASEAIRLCVEFAFYNLNLNKVNAGYYGANIGSGKAFEKCGFKYEGKFEDEVFYKGKYIEIIRIGLTKKNYELINK